MVSEALAHPTTNWFQLNESFYRREERYKMLWKRVRLAEQILSVGSASGLIAVTRDLVKLSVAAINLEGGSLNSANEVGIYSSSGKPINVLKWEKGRLVSMGWSEQDKLILVFAEGVVRIYSIFGSMDQFSMGLDNGDEVVDSLFWPKGLVARTKHHQFFAVTNFDEPRPRKLAPPAIQQDEVFSWGIIPPEKALSQHVEVYLATGRTLMTIDSKGAQDQMLQQGPFTHVVPSPSGSYIALYNQEGVLLVVAVDFQQKLVELEINLTVPPHQVVWSGNDLILVASDGELTAVGPFGDYETFYYDGVLHVVPEIDGARIFTDQTCEFIQKVPAASQNVFSIGSTSPAALLYDALDHFEKNNPKADENVRIIGSDLEEAVNGCIEAAGCEWSPQLQKSLLKAASFGKCFLDHYDSDKFVSQCQRLRVLNALRQFEVGLPMTLPQFDWIGLNQVIMRLLEMHQHLLALKVCEYLRVPSDRIVVHWACAKIRASIDDEETTSRLILDKIGSRPGLSYHRIAQVASENGQMRLAIKLLDKEPCAQSQVPMLMVMGENERALDKAIASGDTNLIYLVLLDLKQKLSLGEFFRLVNSRPVAGSLLELYCNQQDQDLLKDFYYQDDRRFELAVLTIKETFHCEDPSEVIEGWKTGSKNLSTIKARTMEAKLAEEQVKLLEYQTQMVNQTPEGEREGIIGASLSETIKLATKLGNHTLATKLRSEFKVSDKRFWWLKIRGYVAAADWDGLENFAKSKRSPIGYQPFYELCVSALQSEQALKYALRCDATVRPELLLKIKAFREAGQQAFANKDPEMIKTIKDQCQDNEIRRELDVYLVQLNSR